MNQRPNSPHNFARLAPAWLLCGTLCSIVLNGCGTQPAPSTSQPTAAPQAAPVASGQSQYRGELLQSAIGLLNSPEQFDDDAQQAAQLVERFNQWRRLAQGTDAAQPADHAAASPNEKTNEKPSDEAATAPLPQNSLLSTLPENLQRLRVVRHLDDDVFDTNYDGNFLREAALMRDVANSVQPDKLDDVSVAQALFNWTVRNLQAESPPVADSTPSEQWMALHQPIETVYFGAGTPLQRAWVFMLLARQRGLDVVLLATSDPRNPNQSRPWVTALLSEGELYLFDFTYGLPIPGPGGKGVATLAQAAADDAVLRQMDIPGDRIYPRKAADLQAVTALLEASPGYLESRMKNLEAYLTGHDRLVLSISPADLADKLHGVKHVDQIKLWAQPYEMLELRRTVSPALQQAARLEYVPFSIPADPEQAKRQAEGDEPHRHERTVFPLRMGRFLQLRGLFGGSDQQRSANQQGLELSEAMENGAKYYYIRAIPTQDQIDEINHLVRDRVEIGPGRRLTPEFSTAFMQRRDDAAYWLGLVSLEQGDLSTAAQYFGAMTLDAYPNGPWSNGARFNLAACAEAQGKLADAIKLYEADKSPQRYGNRLRAARLKEQPAEKSAKPAEKSTPPTKK